MIAIRGLTKRFGALDVLRGVDLDVRAGRVTAIVGPNGAGKTTLIKSILGLTKPDGGSISIDGVTLGRDPGYRARMGYMPQIARFPDNVSAGELFDMLRDLRGVPRDGTDDSLLRALGLDHELGKPLRTLSGGTRQKVNAVAAFLFRPPMLILDEPTAGLDPIASGVLKDRVLAERDAGRTFVLTSHIMSEIDELADDVAFLLEGTVRYVGPVAELKQRTRQVSLERAVADLMTRGLAA